MPLSTWISDALNTVNSLVKCGSCTYFYELWLIIPQWLSFAKQTGNSSLAISSEYN